MFTCDPIGYFHSAHTEKYMAGKQSGLCNETGRVVLNRDLNFEQALEDLQGFERIWLIYWFDRNNTWKPKVNTPRGGPKRGVFATRSPHRPNPIGLSCVELIKIEGRTLFVGNADLLDGTPILDIKPYVNYADAFPTSKQGWLEELPCGPLYSIEWSDLSLEQTDFIENNVPYKLKSAVELRLSQSPLPFPSHRIEQLDASTYMLGFKTWRIIYVINGDVVHIQCLCSGYDEGTLAGIKTSKWDDVPLHLEFIKKFGS